MTHIYTHLHIHTHTHTIILTTSSESVYMVNCGAPQSAISVLITTPYWKGQSYNSVVLKDFFRVMYTQPSVISIDHGFQILPATCVSLLPQVKYMSLRATQ